MLRDELLIHLRRVRGERREQLELLSLHRRLRFQLLLHHSKYLVVQTFTSIAQKE